jgi:hypothetical protein
MRKLLCLFVLALSFSVLADDPVTRQDQKIKDEIAEKAFLSYLPKVKDEAAKKLFERIMVLGDKAVEHKRRIGRLLIVATQETPKMANQREGIVKDALEVVEIWVPLYVDRAPNKKKDEEMEQVLTLILTGFPEDGKPTVDLFDLLKVAKEALLKARGDVNSDGK